MTDQLKDFLIEKAAFYEQPEFIKEDPISIPHHFTKKQDIEIAGFFAAILAWGNRKSIIQSCDRLLHLMDRAPYDFILHFKDSDLAVFTNFAYRTFNATDLFHFFDFLQYHYAILGEVSLETTFSRHLNANASSVEPALRGFYNSFFDSTIFLDYPKRTRKHIATPEKKSACKRLNLFLRWMVRSNNKGVDFGIWQEIKAAQLICPLDLHVGRVARRLGLLQRSVNDWQAALQLTQQLSQFDKKDPVKYDFALFGLGIFEKY